MNRRLGVRLGISLGICALVGLVLLACADEDRWAQRDGRAVTSFAETLDGRPHSATAEELDTFVADPEIPRPEGAEPARFLLD